MAIQRSNSDAFNDAQKYTDFVIQTLPEILLPDGMYRNVSDFADGNVLDIPTIGAATIQEVAEGIPLNFTAIDSGTVQLQITDYIGDAWFVSDEARQDYRRLAALEAARAMESSRALAEYHETRFLATAASGQTDADPNVINNVAHRLTSTETGNVASWDMFRFMKYAFDKARVPQGGRIALVDPSVEYILNGDTLVTTSDNPRFEGIITEGFARDHRFIRNVYGWDIWTTDLLPKGTFSDGTTTVTDTGVTNLFMSVLSDQHTPVMYAERVGTTVEGWRDHEERREKFQTTRRDGWGVQRADTLGVVITDTDV